MLKCGLNEALEQRMGVIGPGFELRVILNAHKERAVCQLHRFYQTAVRRQAGQRQTRAG